MIGSATRSTTGKKILAIFVAIAMVLTMSNISAYYASANDDVKSAEEKGQVEKETTEPEEKGEEVTEPAATDNGDADTEGSDENESDENGTDDQPEGTSDTGSNETAGGNNGTEGNNGSGEKPQPKIVDYYVIYHIGYVEKGPKQLTDAEGNPLNNLVVYGEGKVGETTSVTPPSSVWCDGKKYDLDVVFNCVLEEEFKGNNNTVNVYYDEAGVDGVPAKYQATVSFTVDSVHGAEINGAAESKVTFKLDGKPSYQPGAVAVVDFPEVIAKDCNDDCGWYLNGKKIDSLKKTTISIEDKADPINFVYNCTPSSNYQATVVFESSDPEIATIDAEEEGVEVTFRDKNGKLSCASDATAVVDLPAVTVNEFYNEGAWYLNGEEKVDGLDKATIPSSMIGKTVTFKYMCGEAKSDTHQLTFDIHFYTDDDLDNPNAVIKDCPAANAARISEEVAVSESKMKSAISFHGSSYTQKGYVLDTILSEAIENGEIDNQPLAAGAPSRNIGHVNVYYATDKIGVNDPNKGDRIADKYQIVVNFAAENGTVLGTEKQVVTLVNSKGDPDTAGEATVVMPATVAKPGYTDDTKTFDGDTADINAIGWDKNVASVNGKDVAALDKDSNGAVYTYTYIPAIYDYEVRCLDADNNALQLLDSVTGKARFGSTVAVKPLVKDVIEKDANTHYLLATAVDENSKITIEIPNSENNSFDAYYDIDAVGENADPFTPDGVADKNQARVDFKAVNGYFTGSTTQFVTLVNGVGILHGPLPVPYNNDGYEDPTWTPSEPTGTTQITGDTTFVITYKAEAEQPDPGETDNPVDNEGDDNAGNTDNAGAGAGIFAGIYTPDAADAADAATEPEADEGEVIPDDENPLVNLPDDQKTIADDENALAGYEEGSQQTWLPFAIVAGIVCAGFLLFLVARRKKDEEDARTTY